MWRKTKNSSGSADEMARVARGRNTVEMCVDVGGRPIDAPTCTGTGAPVPTGIAGVPAEAGAAAGGRPAPTAPPGVARPRGYTRDPWPWARLLQLSWVVT